jgi:prepilin-type N-terminal cleavage/methylation domain-containing protein
MNPLVEMGDNITKQIGFTLLEIIIVLAIIGALAGVIIPNLHMTFDSQMSSSLKTLTATIHESYNDALFSKRMHRMVLNIKTGEYWVEQAPVDFKGRPPLIQGDSLTSSIKEDAIKNFLDAMNEKTKNQSKREIQTSTSGSPTYYSLRSIPEVQKDVLIPIKWIEVNTSTITKNKLNGDVIFAKFISGISSRVVEYKDVKNKIDKDENNFCYIYFLIDGITTPASIQLAIKNKENDIDDTASKYTVYLNALTGQSSLLEGFQDANFTLPKK